ncbi:MAG: 4Fe-4S binding protein [Spirochaetes bacterium]|jgi:ferredoxin|nr:4Fe-4S binding protein [Spirochaetota bacterium]NLJ05864.1 4Fe-4S binding protein [Exilispira sp.]MBP8990666.1 4Fe-4S binding protein [Spirochaetota bacterium]HNV43687.1 4Fe-4S binding protein [Exilispira sp.]HOV45453.1 4Fe-4S binding protein [Exilispira sp.]
MIYIDKECLRCNACVVVCPSEAIEEGDPIYKIIDSKCTSCEKCIPICPVKAIKKK